MCFVLKKLALAPQSFLHLMSCRNLLGLPERRSTFPGGLETESLIPCIDLDGGGWFGRVAEQSSLTGYEPKNLIVISSQHTPINFPSRRNSFNADLNDVPHRHPGCGNDFSVVNARKRSEPFGDSVHRQQRNAQQPASSSVMHGRSCWKLQHCVHDHDVRSCGKLQRCNTLGPSPGPPQDIPRAPQQGLLWATLACPSYHNVFPWALHLATLDPTLW